MKNPMNPVISKDWDQGILSSLNLVGAVISSAICFRWADVMGRKKEVRTTARWSHGGDGDVAMGMEPLLMGKFDG